MRRIAVIRYLITHTRQQLEFSSITKFGIELSLDDVKDMSEIAPMIRHIPGRIFYQAHTQIADGEGAPGGLPRLAGMDGGGNAGPGCHGSRNAGAIASTNESSSIDAMMSIIGFARRFGTAVL